MEDSDTRRPESLPSAKDALKPARAAATPLAKPDPARENAPPSPPPATVRDKPTRPTRVRDNAPPAQPVHARETAPPPARDLAMARTPVQPTRDIEVDEETWTVSVKGAASVGSGHAGARILSVAVEGPGERADPDATRYVLARNLQEVDEDELVSLVREVARPPGPTSTQSVGRKNPRGRGSSRRRGRP